MPAVHYLDSVKTLHFTGAIATNAVEYESIDFPDLFKEAGVADVEISGISIQSNQNLEWDVIIFSSDSFATADLDTTDFVDYFNFPATSGKQIAGAGQYYYPLPANNVEIPYHSGDSKLHIGLINRSVVGKNAGATGEVKIRLMLEPNY